MINWGDSLRGEVPFTQSMIMDRSAHSNHALEALHAVAVETGGQPDTQAALSRIVGRAVELLDADGGGGVSLYEPKTGLLTIVAGVGAGAEFTGRSLRPGQGITGQAFATGEAQTITQYPQWEGGSEEFPALRFQDALAAPMRWHGHTLGAIFVLSSAKDQVSADDIRLLELFGAQAAHVIGDTQLADAEHAARVRADAMLEATQALSSSLSLPEVLQQILESCRLVLPFVSGTIITLDAGRPRLVAQLGFEGHQQIIADRTERLLPDNPIFQQMMRDRQCVIIPDTHKHPGWTVFPDTAYIHAWIGVPLVAHRQLIGILSLDSEQVDTYTDDHRRLAMLLGAQAAIAIDHARLFGATQEALTQVEILFRASQAITAAGDLPSLLATFVEPLLTSEDARAVLLTLEPTDAGTSYRAEVVAEAGGGKSSLLGRRYDLPIATIIRVWNASHIDLLSLSAKRKRSDAPIDAFQPLRQDLGGGSATLVPLLLDDRRVGAIALAWAGQREVSAQERQYLNVLKPQVAAIMENRRLLRVSREAENRFRDIAQSLSDWLWEVDRKGRLVYCSEQVERVTGYTVSEIVGQLALRFPLTIEQREGAAGLVALVARGEPFSGVEVWLRHKQGYLVCTQMSGVPIRDGRGRLSGYRGSAKDITRQKKIEQRERLAFDLGQKLTSVLSPSAVIHTFIEQLVGTFGYYHVTIWQADRAGGTLSLMGGSHPFDTQRVAEMFTMRTDAWPSLIAKSARSGEVIISNDVLIDPDYRAIEMLPDTRSELVLPLVQGDQLLGVLDVESDETNTFTADEVRALQNLAAQASIAIENARLYARLSEQADLLEELVAQRTQDVVKERERLQAIVEHAGEGIMFTDPDGAIEYVNHAWETITGWRAGDILGQNTTSLFTDHEGRSGLLPPNLSGETTVWQGELHAHRPDGSEYDAGLTLAPVTDARGTVINLVGVMHDITAQKYVDQMRSKFVANVSHELRTPITNLKLYHTLVSSVSADKQPEYLTTMGDQLSRLENLVEDLLDISRLDRGVVEIHPDTLDLNRLIGQVVVGHRMRAERRRIGIEVELEDQLPTVWADQRRMAQVLNNLLINAINYSGDGGMVQLRTWRVRDVKGGAVMISVSDAGMGIAPEDLPFVFDRFFRSEAAKSAGIPGTGLGLSIVHDIVELHRGTIGVESAPGKGTVFTVRLPTMGG